MTRKRWIFVLGIALSLPLVIFVFMKVDWLTFWTTIQQLSLPWLIIAGVITIGGTLLRALRWLLIAGGLLEQYRFYCHATNYGYLANAVLPARAGEAVRMISIVRSTGISIPKAMTSAIIDRLADLIMLGVVTLLVASHHGSKVLSQQALISVSGLIIVALLGVLWFLFNGEGYQGHILALSRRLPRALGSRLPRWYMEAYEGVRPLRNRWRMSAVALLNLVIILSDYAAMWILIIAFGWSLPFWAALTVGVFITAGSSLPSAPGYVGIYQVACILALRLFGVDSSSAVAYAVVLQLLNLAVIILLSFGSLLDTRFIAYRRSAGAQVQPLIAE